MSYAIGTHVRIKVDDKIIEGNLRLPRHADGIVVFAHGSGSSRHSPRNQFVAHVLGEAGLGTLLIDLLTTDEEAFDFHTGQLRFDIPFLAERLIGATDWLLDHPETRDLSIGYFGASTGAGAALVAAAERPHVISAVVSRGGRPDLAHDKLSHVKAPTLLIVGGNDLTVIQLNQVALDLLSTVKHLEIVPRAGHLFEEPGTLEVVAHLARQWFSHYLVAEAQEKRSYGTTI
jgi:putative phosphoribosyl transferase